MSKFGFKALFAILKIGHGTSCGLDTMTKRTRADGGIRQRSRPHSPQTLVYSRSLFGRGRTLPGFIFCKPLIISCSDAVLLTRDDNLHPSFRNALLPERIDRQLKSIMKWRDKVTR